MRLNDLDLNLLKVFVLVAEENSFTQAAKKLFVEQSAVSKSMKRLEEVIGAPLFVRTKRQVRLTSKGVALLPIAKGVLISGEDFLKAALDKHNEISGTVKFGAESPLSFLFLPEVIRQLSIDYPALWPMMFTGITEDMIRRVKNRELEFALVLYEGNRLRELEYREVGKLDFHLVRASSAPSSALNSFIGSREVNDSETPHLPTFSKLKKMNKDLQIKYSANDLMAYRELVLGGLGIGLLPDRLVRNDLKEKKLKKIYPELKLNFPVFLVKSAGYPLGAEAERMIEVFRHSLCNS